MDMLSQMVVIPARSRPASLDGYDSSYPTSPIASRKVTRGCSLVERAYEGDEPLTRSSQRGIDNAVHTYGGFFNDSRYSLLGRALLDQ